MSKVNIGDKVKVVSDYYIWLTDHNLDRETILTVVESDDDYNSYVDPDNLTIEIDAIKEWPEDFEKVEDMFFAGCNPPQTFGLMGEQVEFHPPVPIPQTNQVEGGWTLNVPVDAVAAPLTLGVYRPNLEDRKIGKVGMHMVDDGFPNALREVAKVMTWAAEAKGYKLHDWKNLPEASVALPSAGYRHRNDNSIQKALGLSAMERVDHESALLHKAHEAFNTLAELELILTGAIK